MPYEDRERAERFYRSTFGWQTQKLGADMGHYMLVTTSETDARAGLPAGAINGGLFPKTMPGAAQHPSVVIGVADIRRSITAVRAAGGEVLGEPHQIPGIGSYVAFIDTEGNRNSMLQAQGGEA
jgi:hypothetical protein